MERAQCRQEKTPTKEFFPVRGASRKEAKSVCSRCPVGSDCQEYAKRTGSLGIWNGEIRKPHPEESNEAEDTLG